MVNRDVFPPWVVLHVPHDSTAVPDEVRDQFLLGAEALQQELLHMTDHHTLALFGGGHAANVVRAPVSRLVVDVERFASDAEEPMAARVQAVMVEVNRRLYMRENDGATLADFERTAARIQEYCIAALGSAA